MNNNGPLFWHSGFVRLFPRSDCAEKCKEREVQLASWRWGKTLLTRADFALRQQDAEFIASVYNVFLRDFLAVVCFSPYGTFLRDFLTVDGMTCYGTLLR